MDEETRKRMVLANIKKQLFWAHVGLSCSVGMAVASVVNITGIIIHHIAMMAAGVSVAIACLVGTYVATKRLRRLKFILRRDA
jgi:hypothetical protein